MDLFDAYLSMHMFSMIEGLDRHTHNICFADFKNINVHSCHLVKGNLCSCCPRLKPEKVPMNDMSRCSSEIKLSYEVFETP